VGLALHLTMFDSIPLHHCLNIRYSMAANKKSSRSFKRKLEAVI